MTEKAIQNIYNKLLKWEGKLASHPYPIHKNLNSRKFEFNDIYEWIANTYTLKADAKVLDAGCGVGYGAMCLSKYYGCNIKGISLSNEEVRIANVFAKEAKVSHLVRFNQQSYDDLEPNSFDFIIAIESVKHTLDVDKTMRSLKCALKPNGILVVVDDFLTDNINQSLIHKYSKDWALKTLLKFDNFTPDFILKRDLTSFVKIKSNVTLTTGILMLNIINPFLKITPIIRGGLYLEKLFALNAMKYYAIEYRN